MAAGSQNIFWGGDHLEASTAFAIGFVSGFVETAITFKIGPSLGAAIGSAIRDTGNIQFSHQKWTWKGFGILVGDVALSTLTAHKLTNMDMDGILSTAEKWLIALDINAWSSIVTSTFMPAE
jgi:hypothetical protein